jgi:hypothetical protein
MSKPKDTRETKYYGVPYRIKPQVLALVKKLDPSKKGLNVKLMELLKELKGWRDEAPA